MVGSDCTVEPGSLFTHSLNRNMEHLLCARPRGHSSDHSDTAPKSSSSQADGEIDSEQRRRMRM